MKPMRYTTYFILLSLLLTSCEKEVPTYNGEEGIYFSVQRGTGDYSSDWAHYPETPVDFLTMPTDDTIFSIPVYTTGKIKTYDRPFSYVINADSTTAIQGVNYEIVAPNPVIPAGRQYGYLRIRLKRADNIMDEEKKIVFQLLANEHFQLSMPVWYPIPGTNDKADRLFDATKHTLRITNFITKPESWTGRVDENGYEIATWGEFSVKKYLLMCEVLNLSYDDFKNENMPTARKELIAEVMTRYLTKLKNGYPETTPVTEDDGRLMYFSGCAWKSKIGVAWVPDDK